MERKPNPKAESVLGLVEPGRRDAMRKMLVAAYAAPAIASFSLDALAAPFTCNAANQDPFDDIDFIGKMDCDGWRFDRASDTVATKVKFQLTAVQVRLLDGATGGKGFIFRGVADHLPIPPPYVTISFADFPDKKDETVGFTVTECNVSDYYETGQWKRSIDKKGVQHLRGESMVLINFPNPGNGITYSLKCHYDLDEAVPAVPG